MREKINKLSKGLTDDTASLVYYEPRSISAVAAKGTSCSCSVRLESRNNVIIKGLAYSSSPEFRVLTPSFGGKEVKVLCECDLRHKDYERVISGDLILVTNGGEIVIPFSITCGGAVSDDSLVSLQTIEDFAHVAQEDPVTALRLFEYRKFTDAPFMQDLRFKALYRAFSQRPGRINALRQFIHACGAHADISLAPEPAAAPSDKAPSVKKDTPQDVESSYLRERNRYYRKNLAEYLRLRLACEISGDYSEESTGRMLECLSAIGFKNHTEYITLLKAEAHLLAGDKRKAQGLVDSVRENVCMNRQELLYEYFLYEYLESLLTGKTDRRESFIRLTRKFIEEEKMGSLLFYLTKLDISLKRDCQEYYRILRLVYDNGSRSPYLYLCCCRFFNEHPEFIHDPDSFDLHALFFGARNHLLSEEVRNIITARARSIRSFTGLYYLLLKALYREYRDKELINAICTVLIRSNRKQNAYHSWYEDAVRAGVGITGLYEYYMYSLPEGYEERLPGEVVRHFMSGDSLNYESKLVLYTDVIRYYRQDQEIFPAYEKRIKDYAAAAIREKKIDRRIAFIYRNVLSSGQLDQTMMSGMAYILSTCSIRSSLPEARSAVIVYPYFSEEQAYSFEKGEAYAPVYHNDAIILIQDANGNRYCDDAIQVEKLLDEADFSLSAENVLPADNLSRISAVLEAMDKEMPGRDDVTLLQYAASSMPITADYKSQIYSKLIDYYMKAGAGSRPEFLLRLDKNSLRPDERVRLLNALIVCDCRKEAYDMIRQYSFAGVTPENLCRLSSGLIIDRLFSEEDLLLYMAFAAFEKGHSDGIILDYLCENYNGATGDMAGILEKSIESQIETYDMEERLLAQCIFVNDRKYIDKVFQWYISRKKISETIVRAYFTLKSSAYFIDEEPMDEGIFDYLQQTAEASSDPNLLPVIYKLTLTKHYSEIDELTETQKKLAEVMVDDLVSENLVFPYYKKLANSVPVTQEVISSEILLYRSEGAAAPVLRSRVSPVQAFYEQEPMRRVYENLYIRRKVLFEGEVWKYEIYEEKCGEQVLKEKGEIHCSCIAGTFGSRYERINSISMRMNAGDTDSACKEIKDYLMMQECARGLFVQKQ